MVVSDRSYIGLGSEECGTHLTDTARFARSVRMRDLERWIPVIKAGGRSYGRKINTSRDAG